MIAATVIGDGEGETGPLMAGWLSNTFLNPVNDGAILPIFYLNGGKIHNPTIFERKTDEELASSLKVLVGNQSLRMSPLFQKTMKLHALFAEKLDEAIEEIKKVQAEARKGSAEEATQPVYPVLIARIPKG